MRRYCFWFRMCVIPQKPDDVAEITLPGLEMVLAIYMQHSFLLITSFCSLILDPLRSIKSLPRICRYFTKPESTEILRGTVINVLCMTQHLLSSGQHGHSL